VAFQETGIVVLPDDGEQALKHAGNTYQTCVYYRYWAFSYY